MLTQSKIREWRKLKFLKAIIHFNAGQNAKIIQKPEIHCLKSFQTMWLTYFRMEPFNNHVMTQRPRDKWFENGFSENSNDN